MQEIILVALLCLYPATLICILLAYSKGYARGAKDIVDLDTEYDRKFKEMIVDFIVGNYVRRDEHAEDGEDSGGNEQRKTRLEPSECIFSD